MSTEVDRACPVCTSGSKEIITKVDFELFNGHPMNGGYDLVQCNHCGFVYANTKVTQDELDHYYAELSKYEDKNISTGGGFTPQDKDRLQQVAVFLEKNIPNKHARIVDLGCANGGLLRELKQLGFTNLVGIDPSIACVNITKEEVGCECYHHSLFDIPESVGKFDVVILSHVLEHLLNVRQTVEILSGLLNKDGYAYIECPNATYYYDVIHAPLQEFNTEHINHFTENAFENLMCSMGYRKVYTGDKILKIASDQDYHAVAGLFQKENEAASFSLRFDAEIRPNIERYISISNRIFDEIKQTISHLPASTPIALFGVGQFAFKLLASEVFRNGRPYKLFDNNRMNAGKKIGGVSIIHGEDLVKEYRKEPFIIIISSLIYEMAIRKNIKDLFEKNGEGSPEMIGFFHLLPDQSS